MDYAPVFSLSFFLSEPPQNHFDARKSSVEPIAALGTLLIAGAASAFLPYLLSFAAGAMLYVVVEELIPEMSEGEHSHAGTLAFAVGFALMIVLEVVLG